MMDNIIFASIPLFVAVDALGTLPIFMSLTHGIKKEKKNKIIYQSMITATCLTIAFILVGKAVFNYLSITVGDFMVAGGIVLFCIAILDIVNPSKVSRVPEGELGVVPLGTPLIAGPAVLTTSLMLIGNVGMIPTIIAVLINVVLAAVVFMFSDIILRFIGDNGTRAFSKIMNLLLCAIAVMMVRKGIIAVINL
ncbi:MAG TPA: MarC family protein [Candidatus Omnitrophota bacterium]|mgnify:CR=1 FL=1|nr:MarC family protein [Candidatus Omnitrophota bacterium]HPS21009.1 MarC family protein [Candidatus Omnitrophota bacterium]